MLTHLLILATTAATAPAPGEDGGLTIKSLYVGGSTLVAIATAVGGYYRGKTKRVDVQDPVNVSSVSDKTFVTCATCKEHMAALALKCATDLKDSKAEAHSAVTNLFSRMTDVEKGVSAVKASVDAVATTNAQILAAIIAKGTK